MSVKESRQIIPSIELCLNLANQLISMCGLSVPLISHIDQIDCNLITSLCETITVLPVPDLLICEPEDKVGEAHNVQAVIDTLSLDFLGLSLSHITGEAIIDGDVFSIFNLLQVLEGVMLYLSAEKNGQEGMKRKINRMKKRSVRSHNGSDIIETAPSTLYPSDSISSNRSITSKSQSLSSLHSRSKRLKPAFSRTRLKAKDGRILRRSSSMKEIKTVSQTHLEPNQGSEQSSFVNIPSLNEDKIPDTVDQNYSDRTPVFSNESVISEKDSNHPIEVPPAEQHEVLQEIQASPSKTLVMKRKISRLPHSKSKDIQELYEENLESKLRALLEKHSVHKTRSSRMKMLHLQIMRNPVKKSHITPCNKSFLLPHSLRRKSTAQSSSRRGLSQKLPPPQKILPKEKLQLKSDNFTQSSGFIQDLLDEFPSIQLSSTIMNHVRTKYEQHLLKMHKKVKSCILRKPKAEIQSEKAAERQHAISKILKKDLHEKQHLKALQEQKEHENKIRYRLRDARLKSVKMKQYCDEFQDEMRKKMQKRNFAEELIFDRAFKEAVNIQKDHVDYLCQQVKETGEEDAKQHLAYILSLENLYQNQFSLLSETLANEKKDVQTRVNAEKQEMNKMQRDFEEALKQEIRFMQRTIVEMTDDCHFRELDAEQYIERIRKQYS